MQWQSRRLNLLPADLPILEAAMKGDTALANYLNIEIDPDWTEYGRESLEYVRNKLISEPHQLGWWTWLPVLRAENRLIGSGGYKGPPTDGVVEIGYEIAPAYRGRGLATEFAESLVQYAFSFPEVERVQAHTRAEENASGRILTKLGFQREGLVLETEEGGVWKWTRARGG